MAEDYEETIQILLESHKVRRRGREEGGEERKRGNLDIDRHAYLKLTLFSISFLI